MKQYTLTLLAALFFISISAQNPTSGEIKQDIKKLGKLASVLYFAAHPDDENQRLISYYAKSELYESAYFSLTRGDGGQNLIGDEKGDLLGVIRTQELLQARNIDGGQQFFSRAVDFGYSKTVEETLNKWNEDSILYDAVWVLRQFQPDVIITRFPPDDRAGHGHHTASAVVAIKAMKMASDPTVFPDQLEQFSPWQVKRLFINTGPWWQPNIDSLARANPGKFAKVNVGEYDEVLGKSYSEIAGASRSQHKSQGFGASLSVGNRWEYLELIEGDAFDDDIMDDIETGWNRVEADDKLQKAIEKCYSSFNDNAPWESLDQLLEIRKMIQETDNEHWRRTKTEEINHIIQSSLGLVVEALAEVEIWTEGKEQVVNLKALNRSPYPIKLADIKTKGFENKIDVVDLEYNEWHEEKQSFLFENLEASNPYWLKNDHDDFFSVGDKSLTGVAEISSAPEFTFTFQLKNEETIIINRNVKYKYVDRVKGELTHDVFVSPEFVLHPIGKMHLFSPNETKEIELTVISMANTGSFSFYPNLSNGWKGPEKIEIAFSELGKPERIRFEVQAPNEGAELILEPYLSDQGKRYDNDRIILEYDHIESKMLNQKVRIKLISLDVKTNGENIAYVEGAGDEIPSMLKEMGYRVNIIQVEDLGKDISEYDALIFGVRAFNVYPELAHYHENILKFTEDGGNVIMQYNTSRGLDLPLGPYPFELSRLRVTDENAKVTILNKKDPVLNYPNKIDEKDFDSWVQERGLYFSDNWDSKYRTPLSWADPGEDQLKGSLLISDYGKGVYIYTSISFFRQLPAGVSGSYRLFSNLIAGGKEVNKLEVQKTKK